LVARKRREDTPVRCRVVDEGIRSERRVCVAWINVCSPGGIARQAALPGHVRLPRLIVLPHALHPYDAEASGADLGIRPMGLFAQCVPQTAFLYCGLRDLTGALRLGYRDWEWEMALRQRFGKASRWRRQCAKQIYASRISGASRRRCVRTQRHGGCERA